MADAGIERDDITGLVLAGGRGSRLGGVDKGLQPYRGLPLALGAAQRLSPQVGRLMISANRHLAEYASWGYPVWPDPTELGGYQGPLVGILSGLQHCKTPCLMVVPCDGPDFPHDLVQRLGAAMTGDTEIAIATTAAGLEPAFCLMRTSVADSLERYLRTGQRKMERWSAQLKRAEVMFDDPAAFRNINTPADLA